MAPHIVYLPEFVATGLILCDGLGRAANDLLHCQHCKEARVAHHPIPVGEASLLIKTSHAHMMQVSSMHISV